MKLSTLFSGLAYVAGQTNTCMDVTSKIKETNSWKDCRDCFNLRMNFNLGDTVDTWRGHVYIAFSEETTLLRIAGPGLSVEYDGRDGEDWRYKVSFVDGHSFGNGQIDVNAGIYSYSVIVTEN